MSRIRIAIVVAIACTATTTALAGAAGKKRQGSTLKLTAVVDSFQQIDNAPEGDSQGDMLVFTQKLTDRSGKEIGTSDAFCVRTAPGRVRECQGTFFLPKGQVFVSGPDPDGVKRHALAIVGGTRAYEDARGHVTLLHESDIKDQDTFHFKR